MLKNKMLSMRTLIIILIVLVICNIAGIYNYSYASTTYTQTVKSGIDAFPESYQSYLRELKDLHSNWTFDAYYTGISWNDLVANETDHGHNRIIATSDSLWKCSCGNVASGYACASESAIRYYMDPRNFLDSDSQVFQFLENSYNNNYNVDIVKSIIRNSFMNKNVTFWKDGQNVTMSYAEIIMDAARESQMSPYAVAIKILQEVGVNGSNSVTGTYSFKYTDGKYYSGYYNFFNYGSYDTGSAVTNGLCYAKDQGWDTPYKAIIGGAKKMAQNYTAKGQNTAYFTKWDVVGTSVLKPGNNQTVVSSNDSSNQLFRHQYMTNIKDPSSQASSLYKTYSTNGIIDQNLNFVIPVYNDMPLANKTPTDLTPDDGDLYYTTGTDVIIRSGPGTSYGKVGSISNRDVVVVVLERETATDSTGRKWDKIKTASGLVGYMASQYLSPCATTPTEPAKKAEISDNNIKAIPNAKASEIASSLNISNYEVTKDGNKIDSNSIPGTGYKIKDNGNGKEYTVVVLGDVNGDGTTDARDSLRVLKYSVGTYSLNNEYSKAADINGDGSIDARDSLRMLKYSVGTFSINL